MAFWNSSKDAKEEEFEQYYGAFEEAVATGSHIKVGNETYSPREFIEKMKRCGHGERLARKDVEYWDQVSAGRQPLNTGTGMPSGREIAENAVHLVTGGVSGLIRGALGTGRAVHDGETLHVGGIGGRLPDGRKIDKPPKPEKYKKGRGNWGL